MLVLLLVYLVSSASFSSQAEGKEPPGPRPLPVLGNLLQLDLKRPYYTLLKLSKKYGSVFTVYLGPQKVVVLAGYKTVKEALVNYADDFGDRDQLLILEEDNQGHGVLWSNGDSWKEMRRFTLTTLRDLGMGKKACEDKIIEECQYLLEVLKAFKGKAFDTTQAMNHSVANIICSIVYGSRFEYDDPKFKSMVKLTNKQIELAGSPSIQLYNLYPWMLKWLAARREIHNINTFFKKENLPMFSRLKETLNQQMCRGLVDAFLVRQQSFEESGNTNSHFHDENLRMTVQNLFVAGTETTSTTLRWGLLLMAKYPKIQDQVQEELSRVIVIGMPFSAGRRICLGESLARMELFIFFTTLLQHFRFNPPPGVSEDELDLTPRVGFTLCPSPHKLCAVLTCATILVQLQNTVLQPYSL